MPTRSTSTRCRAQSGGVCTTPSCWRCSCSRRFTTRPSSISSSDDRAVRRFLRHLARFCLLPAAVVVIGEGVLVGSGEVWPIDRVIAFQRAHPDSRFLRAIDQVFYASKYRGVLARQPSVLVAGSSRTMKFRAAMFGDRAMAFFNAGGMINSLDDLEDFGGSFAPPRLPDVVILGIDLWWLNDRVVAPYRF